MGHFVSRPAKLSHMDRARAKTSHVISDRPPLRLKPGDVVGIGERDTTWPPFVYVVAEQGEGWAPFRYLVPRGEEAVAETGYDTTELASRAGEELEVLIRDDESGWHWCRNYVGMEGWVPVNTLEEITP